MQSTQPRRVFVLGATGTIGRATVRSLVRRGHDVVCFLRPGARAGATSSAPTAARLLHGAAVRFGDVTQAQSLLRDGFAGERFDTVVSCMASRNGSPRDAWAVDYEAHLNVLKAAQGNGVGQFVLLSAICVQKPLLAFQQAKLAFENKLIESGLNFSIVRPTAFFKSLSGQIARLQRGKPFLLFAAGDLTSCKPIADEDLAEYLADCLDDPELQRRILPIGGPGDAITPREQGERLFELLGLQPRFRHVPVALLDRIIATLALLGRWLPKLADKAELGRIGRYYATESMLVLDPRTGCYDASATPATGTRTLFDYYAEVIRGEATSERGDHSVF